jgi:trk system potassium uptake protein TrkH
VRSTGHDFSWLGQLVILILIQLGGIGIMTVTTYVTFQLGGRQSLRHRMILSDALGAGEAPDLRSVLRRVLRLTLLVEGAGIVILTVRFLFDYAPAEALWQGIFHTISAFNNAGFGLHDDSLTRYQDDWIVNFTMMGMVIIGGIGYPVILDVMRHRRESWSELWEHLTLHSKVMLVGSAFLVVAGTASILVLEWDGVLADAPWHTAPIVALFHSVSTRTAGFNSVDLSAMNNASLFITMLLMMIGAGPGSTGGGFKVTTFVLLAARAWSSFRGYSRVNLFRRTVPHEAINRAISTALIFSVIAVAALVVLLAVEQSKLPHRNTDALFLDAAFEVISALATVGLSTGLTTQLSDPGRLVLIALMFIGRLGPITVFAALARTHRDHKVEYVHDAPLFG